jgi:8-oxo-dGTP diphosphatase
MPANQQFPILAASACVWRSDEVLLIQRGREPGKGKWALPGGKVHWGETAAQAALRELEEETGIQASLGEIIGLYELIQPDMHFAIACYAAFNPVGEIRCASDASDVRWVNKQELSLLPLLATNAHAISSSLKLLPPR